MAGTIAVDPHKGSRVFMDAPGVRAEVVVYDDDDELPEVPRALWIGSAGNVQVKLLHGGSVQFKAVPAGTMLHIRARQVFVTGTSVTAGNIIAIF